MPTTPVGFAASRSRRGKKYPGWRKTCAIGFCHGTGLRLFLQTRYGTFIDEREIVTTGRAVELATDVSHARNGVPVVMHPTCASRFVVKGRFRRGDIALLEQVEPIDPDFTMSDAALMNAPVSKQRANLSPLGFLGQNPAFGRGSSWRRGSESNTPEPGRPAHGGFEDRGGHQAPFTLPERAPDLARRFHMLPVPFCREREVYASRRWSRKFRSPARPRASLDQCFGMASMMRRTMSSGVTPSLWAAKFGPNR